MFRYKPLFIFVANLKLQLMGNYNITVCEETALLCNINTILDDLCSYTKEYHDLFERKQNLSAKELDGDNEKWRQNFKRVLITPLQEHYRALLLDSVKESITNLRETL